MANKITKAANLAPPEFPQLFSFSLRTKYIFLAVIGFIFYANSSLNRYALDDNLIIVNNAYVQMGFTGIPKILTHDSYAAYFTYTGSDPTIGLSGGRFRPLSEIVFAIEEQLFRGSAVLPYFRHLVNVLAYVSCIIVLFYFLEKYLLKNIRYGNDIAFLSTLLFTIHPIHTEVVANIKSLDEILSFLFIILTFIYNLKYLQSRKNKFLALSCFYLFLAFLSKEYAVTLLLFIPLLFYLYGDNKSPSFILVVMPYYLVFAGYLILRYFAVGFHIDTSSANILYNNPYLYATHSQKIATEWYVLGKYLKLLIFPYPLSCDYSYNQIPYHNFSDLTVLSSIVIYAGIFASGIAFVLKKHILSFAVFFFLFNLFLISNLVLSIGATMGERLVFHSSLGFCIIVSYMLISLFQNVLQIQIPAKRIILTGALSVIGIVCFGETVIRNTQWKDDSSLSIHDVEVVPNSFLMNNNAGYCYLLLYEKKDNTGDEAKTYLDSARRCLFLALHFNPQNEFTYHILGLLYDDIGLYDSARYCYDMVEKIRPNLPALKSNYQALSLHYFNKGLHLAKEDDNPREGIIYMKKALLLDSTNESIWYDLGIAYYHLQQYDSEKYALLKTLQLKPDSFDAVGAKKYLQELEQMKRP